MQGSLGQVRPLPASGVIRRGQLDGWHYLFRFFRARANGLDVVAICTPPAWPFPREIPLNHIHFGQLRAIPGERAKRLNVEPYIAQAYALAGLQMPSWITNKKLTLRSIVKRAHSTTAKAIQQ